MNKDEERWMSRAADLCARGEKCSFDISQKLQTWGAGEDSILKVLNTLKQQNFIDDERYSRFFVRDKLKLNKWGRIKISFALRQKHMDSALIDTVLQEINQAEYEEILDEILRVKLRSVGSMETYQEQAKLLRFAAQKGFTSEEIYRSLDRIKSEK